MILGQKNECGMSKIYDNIGENKFENGLHEILTAPGVRRADFCVGYFNLRGWKSVADDIEKLPGDDVLEKTHVGGKEMNVSVKRTCRLLIGMYRPLPELIRDLYAVTKPVVDAERVKRWKRMISADFRRQLTLGAPTAEDEASLKKLRDQLVNDKVAVKLYLHSPLHAKLYLAHRPKDPTPILSIMGSSNLTYGGLSRNGELNAEFADVGDTKVYDKWFNDRWNNLYCIDITKELVEALDASWASIAGYTPYEVYLKIMYHLSREARSGVNEYHLPAPFDKELFEFQQTAVKLAVRHLEKRGGAMIGDVVGLGKTITACAVAKFYEEARGNSVLVLCPANLKEMWAGYRDRYDLKMEIKSIAEKFKPGEMRYFPLVIVDESQNLRNSEGQRYARVKELLIAQQSKVLLLTATPYNKDFSDLASQLKLFVDPEVDLGIRPEAYIKAIGGDRNFAAQHPNTLMTSLGAFEQSFQVDDWRDLMKLYLVRRTRTFIKKNYAKKDDGGYYLEFQDGTKNYFPDRKPISLLFDTKPGDQFEKLYSEEMVDILARLKLPRYGLQQYVNEAKVAEASKSEKQVFENLSRAGRRLMGFCRSNFYKRMDSSGVAFIMSLYRYAVRNAMYLHAIKNGLDLPLRVGAEIDDGYTEDNDGQGEVFFKFPTEFSEYEEKGKAAYQQVLSDASKSITWISPKFFKKSLAMALKQDVNDIIAMLELCGEWKPALDEKLNLLENILTGKHGKDKVLVFTQYSDTARYIAGQLKARGLSNVAQVDGDTEDVVLQTQLFSPVSNRVKTPIPEAKQTRVLIATDMLSEGQNLQDAHVIVNFDLPWAIIRLIQRAGRVDRIGQKAKTVFCYSFFPQEGINEVIELRDRLNRRINENAGVIGSDEVFFEGNEQNLKDLFNEKSGILEDEDEGEVDLSSQAYQIWASATKDDKALADKIKGLADVIYSTKAASEDGQGVITYAKTKSENDVLMWLDTAGKVKTTSPIKIFRALACSAKTPRLDPLPNHHDLVRTSLEKVATAGIGTIGGVLGAKNSPRYRLFTMIENRLKENLLPLFEQGLKEVSDELFNYPLKESARALLGKMLQTRSADDVIEAALELHKECDLCIVPEEDDDNTHAAKVICSMGLA